MKTPQMFIDEYNGKCVNSGKGWNDSNYGYQCVAGYKCFCEWIGIPVYPTGTNYADGYWYLRYDNPTVVKTFDFITNPSQLQKGDWCFWASGSSCPSSHVSMFVGYADEKGYGYFFGQNQGGAKGFPGFQTVKIKLDILGAFRWKEWNDDMKLIDGLQTVVYNNATYHVFKGYNGMKLYMLSAVGDDHAVQDITDYDDKDLLIYAVGNCNYFQMNQDDYGQHYGVEFSRGDGIHSQANQYLPFNKKYIAYYEKDNHSSFVWADKFWIDNFDFACSPYSVRIHNGQDVNIISPAFTNKEEYVTNQTAYFKLKSGEWCIAVSESKVKPQSIVSAMKSLADIEEMFIVDGGGSSQLWAWDRTTRQMEKALYTGRALPNVLCLATANSELDPIVPEPIPTPEPTPEPIPEPVTPEPIKPSKDDDDMKEIVDNATKDGYLFEMSDKVYDWLKVITAFILPLLIREYPRFAEIWGWGYSEPVVNTLAELITIINAILYVSSVGYHKMKGGDE